MPIISLISASYTLIAAITLFVCYVGFFRNLNRSWLAVSSCAVLLAALMVMQWWHLAFLLRDADPFTELSYRICLFLAPPAFYLFSRSILLPESAVSPWLLLHFSTLLLILVPKYEVAIALIFTVGTAYSAWFAQLIFQFGARRKRYRMELFYFSLFALLAIAVLIMGLLVPYMDNGLFYHFYANGIALCFMLIVPTLIIFPDMVTEMIATATTRYAQSTLKDVPVQASLDRLQALMVDQQLYQNESLNLATTAEAMDLTSHQLSELINVHFGVSFSRYIREQRIEAAKQLLIKQPDASILAISLETGFRSQSNFYAAFKALTGQSPGDYRATSVKSPS